MQLLMNKTNCVNIGQKYRHAYPVMLNEYFRHTD